VIYGSEYWNRVINFQAFVDAGTVAPQDTELFKFADTPEDAFEFLRDGLTKHHLGEQPKKKTEVTPEIAKTRP
jgi:predicted Rossmann-fold nucleotide-binding protein